MRVFAGVMGGLLLAVSPPAFAQDQGAGTIAPSELFQESHHSMSRSEWLEPYSNPIVARNRQATIDTSSLFRPASNGPVLALNLFPDVELKAQVENTRSLPSGASFMYGSLEDGGHITLFINKEGIVRGQVHSPSGIYTIRSSEGNNDRNENSDKITTTIRQIDTSNLPPVDDGAVHAGHKPHSMNQTGFILRQGSILRRNESPSATPDETVDILVVYTADAEASEGGEDEIKAAIEAEIEKTNQAFINSGLSHRKIGLAAVEKVDYTQSTDSIGDDLLYLLIKKHELDDPKGLLDEVHDLREKYAADLVHLIVKQPTGNCGIATIYALYEERYIQNFCADQSDVEACIQQQRKDFFQHGTFSVSAIPEGCRLQNVFTHELGHNFGIFHDRYSYNNPLSLDDPENFPLTPYGFGYVNQNFSRSKCSHTVMADGGQCIDEGYPFVVKELMFSNPDLQLGSEEVGYDPAGVPGEEWTIDLDGPVNASRAIDEVWDTMANLLHSSTACSEMLLSSVPDTIRTSASGKIQRYTISPTDDEDYCFRDDLQLIAESTGSFIKTSVETRTVIDGNGNERYEYDLAIAITANSSCRSRTGSISFNGDGISREIAVRQSRARRCALGFGPSWTTTSTSNT